VNEDGLVARIRPRRRVTGMSAILLPHLPSGGVDWEATQAHMQRTVEAGLVPAVNMDTGYVQLIDDGTAERVLDLAADATSGDFVAGAFVPDEAGSPFDLDRYLRAAEAVADRGGTPVIFPSHGLNALDDAGWVDAHRRIGGRLDRFIGFELGPMFVPYGRIPGLDAYRELMAIPSCIGAKHSSLDRGLEWQRLELRDRYRPDFLVLTGNDLAIDMVMYGSDYLLGLSTFAPDLFARRDRLWADGDPRFHDLDDLLQFLGEFSFRQPVPAYRHDAAIFLEMQGWATSDVTPAGVPRRPEGDREVLAGILARLDVWR
jgi:dihydrodipicolinate synthase/N-acetylneuraminate lyase